MRRKYENIYQFRIELKDIRPLIWRRIQVPETYSFWDLHVAIQDAMGWLDCHLHAFRIGSAASGQALVIGIPGDEFDEDVTQPGWDVGIASQFTPGSEVEYEYDFGDSWCHLVTLEKILPREPKVRYPRCADGERACPPEDCGGVPGYAGLLEVIMDPKHEEHESMLTWIGGRFQAERFDATRVKFSNPRIRWQNAFGEADGLV